MQKNPGEIIQGATVVICCYNSAARLPETLHCLAKQNILSDFCLEIIVVNNASTDNTVQVATDSWNQFNAKNIQLKIVNEPRPGQMFARIKGAAEASFETLVFCDDDNHLDKNYVWQGYERLRKDAAIGAVGGQNLPVTNANEYPEWFLEYKNYYGMGKPGPHAKEVTYILGAGLVTRKHLFLQLFNKRYPSLLNGRDGTSLSTGDDFEYCKRLLLRGYKLGYEEKLVLHHFIPKERLTLQYREKLMQGIKDAGKILAEYDLAIRVFKKNKNKYKWRLLLLSPFRILFSKLGWSKRLLIDEELTLYYLSPFYSNSNSVRSIIKKFMYKK